MSARQNRAFAARIRKLSKTITHADLTAATNGLEQNIALGTLPPNAIVLGRAFRVGAYFTGGGATSVGMSIGTAASPAAIMAAANVFDTTALNTWLSGTSGVGPTAPYSSAALVAQFDADASHTLLALTAGSIEVEVYFAVAPADRDL